jgi:hypothetical protein
LLIGGIDLQHGLERILDWTAVLESLPQAERFSQHAHVGGHPEMPVGPLWIDGCRAPAGFHTAFVLLPLAVAWHVLAKPVADSRELPCGFEIVAIAHQPLVPYGGRALRAGKVRPIGVEAVRIFGRRRLHDEACQR